MIANTKNHNERLEPSSVKPAMGTRTVAYEAGDGQIHEAGGIAASPVHEVSIDKEIYEMPDRRRNFGQWYRGC